MNACLAESIESARLADWLNSWLTRVKDLVIE